MIHDLMIAKLKAYGFSKEALKSMKSYLKNRKQKVQINNKFSSERDVIAKVLQGSIDGPLLFNLFVNDLVFFVEECVLSNYVDDNNFSISGEDKELIKSMPLSDFMIVEDWCYEICFVFAFVLFRFIIVQESLYLGQIRLIIQFNLFFY